MNFETHKKNQPMKPLNLDPNLFEDEEFNFKPITTGLGFHHKQNAPTPKAKIETKPLKVNELRNRFQAENQNVYENDLSLFYGKPAETENKIAAVSKKFDSQVWIMAPKSKRIISYLIDLSVVASFVSLVMIIMASLTATDLSVLWSLYPNEMTPLFVTLFCGFYIIYFSIFEKSSQSTLGKNILGLKVVDNDEKQLGFATLVMRSLISILNFASLGLFSHFDLQNKITHSKVVFKK